MCEQPDSNIKNFNNYMDCGVNNYCKFLSVCDKNNEKCENDRLYKTKNKYCVYSEYW